MKYCLMNKDKEIVSFETIKNEYDAIDVVNVSVKDETRLPIGYKGIASFIDHRRAPKHRKYIENLLRQLGGNDIDGYIKIAHAASLTDTFWVRNEQESKTWQDVSLFRNEFDETIAKIAFEGGSGTLTTTTPELSVDGAFAKCWIRENDELFLLKRGSETYGREVFAEYYASQLAKFICTDSVEYELTERNGHLATKCGIFTNENVGISEFTNFVKEPRNVTLKEILAKMESLGSGDAFRRMMVFDALVLNIDRHLGNYGVLFNADSLEPIRMAPVFDNNRSMLFNLSDEQFMKQDMNKLLDVYPRLEGDFNIIAGEVLTDSIRADLKNLSGFEFGRHQSYNLPEERLKKYEVFIDSQIDKILNRIKLYI